MKIKQIKIGLLVGTIFVFLFCINLKVIANHQVNTNSFGETYPYLTCVPCQPEPEQWGNKYFCPPGPIDYCPFTLPCGYGMC